MSLKHSMILKNFISGCKQICSIAKQSKLFSLLTVLITSVCTFQVLFRVSCLSIFQAHNIGPFYYLRE
jgi:hypothetical protein